MSDQIENNNNRSTNIDNNTNLGEEHNPRFLSKIYKKIRLFFSEPKEAFPPVLSQFKHSMLWVFRILITCLMIYIIDQFCLGIILNKLTIFPCSVISTYTAFGLLLTAIIINRYINHKILVHEAKLVDPSEVESSFVEARTIENPETAPLLPKEYKIKKKQLEEEVYRLEKKLGRNGWTEYQILSLYQMLVEFLDVYDLIGRARLSLEELQEYAEDSAYRYDWEKYYFRKQRINNLIEDIEDLLDNQQKNESKRETKYIQAVETLRAELRTLLEHVADYRANWAEGTAVRNSLTIVGVAAIMLLPVMGLLPILHPDGREILYILNWGLLGMSGAIAALLLNIRKSDLVEVGNTQGKKEFWRSILGAALGYMAGILAYSMIAGSLISEGTIFPNVYSSNMEDIGLSVIWAVASGFSFEKVFDRMRSTTYGESL